MSAGPTLVSPDVRLQPDTRRALICSWQHVTSIVDVGANVGQFARRIRAAGFTGHIHSFEPGNRAFAQLQESAAVDPYWTAHQLALGRTSGHAQLHVAEDSCCSSLLAVSERQLDVVPRSGYTDSELVDVARLDELWPSVGSDHAYVKLDVQGTELDVLAGAEKALRDIAVLEAELSLVQLYKDSPLFGEVLEYLCDNGFLLASVDPGFEDARTGEMLQFDGIFVRS